MKTILVAAFVVLAIGSASATAQSLGEIAKKAAEAKAAKEKDGRAKPPVKTITNKDLADPSAAKPEPVKADVPVPVPAAKVIAAAPTTGAKDETYWKDRQRTLDTTLSNDQNELLAAEAHIVDVERFVRRDGTMAPAVFEQLVKARARRDKAIRDIANDKRVIFELEEEARKAGVPPGWLRWK